MSLIARRHATPPRLRPRARRAEFERRGRALPRQPRRARHRARADRRSGRHAAGRPQAIPGDAAACSDKELVLTFDDGPWPATTPSECLHALKHECVRATFFLLGRNAADAPALARREAGRGPQHRPPQLLASAAQPHDARHARRPKSTAASPPSRPRSTASLASKPASAVLPLPGLCRQPGAARAHAKARVSWCSAPMSGRATGCR